MKRENYRVQKCHANKLLHTFWLNVTLWYLGDSRSLGKIISSNVTPCAVTFSWWWGIEYLVDPDSYAGWSLYSC